MSEIRSDTFSDSAGTGPATFTGQAAARSTFAYNQSTPVLDYSLNVSSVTDSSAGNFTVNHTNNFAEADAEAAFAITQLAYIKKNGSATVGTILFEARNSSDVANDGANFGGRYGDLA